MQDSYDIIHITSDNANIYGELIDDCLSLFADGFKATVPTFSESELRSALLSGNQSWYVLLEREGGNSKPISIASHHMMYGMMNSIWNLCTARTHRRAGYARALLAHIRKQYRGIIYIKADNEELMRFYAAAGYTSCI
jgi:GNAT superfamily N-acetyltransferase